MASAMVIAILFRSLSLKILTREMIFRVDGQKSQTEQGNG